MHVTLSAPWLLCCHHLFCCYQMTAWALWPLLLLARSDVRVPVRQGLLLWGRHGFHLMSVC